MADLNGAHRVTRGKIFGGSERGGAKRVEGRQARFDQQRQLVVQAEAREAECQPGIGSGQQGHARSSEETGQPQFVGIARALRCEIVAAPPELGVSLHEPLRSQPRRNVAQARIRHHRRVVEKRFRAQDRQCRHLPRRCRAEALSQVRTGRDRARRAERLDLITEMFNAALAGEGRLLGRDRRGDMARHVQTDTRRLGEHGEVRLPRQQGVDLDEIHPRPREHIHCGSRARRIGDRDGDVRLNGLRPIEHLSGGDHPRPWRIVSPQCLSEGRQHGQSPAHVADSCDALSNIQGQERLHCLGAPERVTVHVPEAGHEKPAAPVDHHRARRYVGVGGTRDNRDPGTDGDHSRVRAQRPRDDVNDRDIADDNRGLRVRL